MAVSRKKREGPGAGGPESAQNGSVWTKKLETHQFLYDSCESGLGLAPGALKMRGVGFRGRILAFEIFEGSPR